MTNIKENFLILDPENNNSELHNKIVDAVNSLEMCSASIIVKVDENKNNLLKIIQFTTPALIDYFKSEEYFFNKLIFYWRWLTIFYKQMESVLNGKKVKLLDVFSKEGAEKIVTDFIKSARFLSKQNEKEVMEGALKHIFNNYRPKQKGVKVNVDKEEIMFLARMTLEFAEDCSCIDQGKMEKNHSLPPEKKLEISKIFKHE